MSEWFKDWFASEEYLQVYSHRDKEEAKLLIEFILKGISIPKRAFVLDAACGAGRHTKIFLEKNYKIVGFDLSKTLLKIAKESLTRKSFNSAFVNADLRRVCFKQKFDLIINLFTSFGYFNDDSENLQFIKDAFSMLKNNGYYIFDYLNPVYVKNNLVPFSKSIKNKREIIEERKIIDGRVEKTITIKSDSETKKYKESVKLYSYNQIENMFSNIGFKVSKSFGDYYGNKFSENKSNRMLIIFKK